MKILEVIHCFPPKSMTGAEIYAYNLAKELSKNHRVSVFYRINEPREEEYKIIKDNYNGLAVYKINNTLKSCNSLEKIYINKDIEEKFSRILEEINPDIVHIHHLLFLSLGIIDEIKKRNIPIVFTLHDYWLVCPRGQLLKNNLEICKNPLKANCFYCLALGLNIKNLFKRLVGFLYGVSKNAPFRVLLHLHSGVAPERVRNLRLWNICKNVDLFISPSKFLQNRFIEFGIPSEKIIYSAHGMDFGLFRDIEKIKSDKTRFGFIGTLIPSKGSHILIQAFNRIGSDKAILKVYGKSPVNNGIFDYYYRIRSMARHNKNIKFMGTFDNEEIAKIFKEIDVLVFPSIWEENSPLVLHEAILTRTPVITSDLGGVRELVRDRGNGFLFKVQDVKELYNKMQDITERPIEFNFDTYFLKDINDNAREIENIYKEIIKRYEN